MCTITLSYNPDNALAQESLAALLATGLFQMSEAVADDLPINYSDSRLYEDDITLPNSLDRNLSLEELENLVVADVRSICSVNDAV